MNFTPIPYINLVEERIRSNWVDMSIGALWFLILVMVIAIIILR